MEHYLPIQTETYNMQADFDIFEGKSFSSLCQDIYERSEIKKDQIDVLINDLRRLVKTIDDAAMIVPRIKDYLEVSVKNDEQLVKLAQVVQRLQTSKVMKGSDDILTEQEKDELFKQVTEIAEEVTLPIIKQKK